MGKPLKKANRSEVSVFDPTSHIHFSVGTVPFVKIKDYKSGHGLVSLDNAKKNGKFPKVNEAMIPPGTYFRVTKDTKRVQCLVTIMPNGVHVAWDMCGACHHYFSLCRCSMGLSTERSVESIFDKWTADQAGEEWDYNHPNYLGSLTRKQREARRGGGRFARRTTIEEFTKPKKPLVKKAKSVQEAPAPAKKILKKRDASQVMTNGTLDLGKLGKEAKTTEAQLTEALTKSIGKKPLKKMIRKATR